MWRNWLLFWVLFFSTFLYAQNPNFSISGKVITHENEAVAEKWTLVLQPLSRVEQSEIDGSFLFQNIPEGTYTLEVYIQNQKLTSKEVILAGRDLRDVEILITNATMSKADLNEGTIINFSELDGDESSLQNIAPLLQSSGDVFTRILSFQWGNYFVRARGLDIRNNKVLINGVEVNNSFDGRPSWRMWGGLNDIFRYPEFALDADPLGVHQGALGGILNYNINAANVRKGTSFGISTSNRSNYQYRLQGKYASGVNAKGWAFALAASTRLGGDPMFASAPDGGFWRSYSFYASLEKQWKSQSLSLSVFNTYNQRGLTSVPLTKEIHRLFGNYVNPRWGMQEGKKRNERINEEIQPTAQLSYRWTINDRSMLTATASAHLGWEGRTELSRYDQPSASPIYYKYLPSYVKSQGQEGATALVYSTSENQPIRQGQVNWDYLYRVNHALKEQNLPAGYTLEEHRRESQDYAFNVFYEHQVSATFKLHGSASYQYNRLNTYARLYDLLGASYVYDVDVFNQNAARNGLEAPTTKRVGDKINYDASFFRSYAFLLFGGYWTLRKWDISFSARMEYTAIQREGNRWNTLYAKATSYGKSKTIDFWLPSLKANAIYKINGNHYLKASATLSEESPSINEVFPNGRYENTEAPHLAPLRNIAADVSYLFRTPMFKGRATYYIISQSNAMDVNFYFLQMDEKSAFLSEVVSGIATLSQGVEVGVDWTLAPGLAVQMAANYNQAVYTNNPDVSTLGQHLDGGFGVQHFGETLLKNLRVPNGPQQAYSLGLNYQTSRFWRFGVSVNYVGSSYVSPSALRRTHLLAINPKTQTTYAGYTEKEARKILAQEELPGAFYANVFVSKSWKIKQYYLGFQLSVNNITNQLDIVTQGFEQARYSTFPNLKEEADRGDSPFFGNRYWYNQGVTFFLNLFFRF